jgi:hypothetical protein
VHTSIWFWVTVLSAVFAASALIINYASLDRSQRTTRQKTALWVGLIAIILTVASSRMADMAAVDWDALPNCGDESLGPGQLCSNGGVIVQHK